MKAYRFDCTFDGHICITTDDVDDCKQRLDNAIDELIKKADDYLKDINNYSLTITNID